MKSILFINRTQFGYHTDYYKYCEYLKEEYDITFLSFNHGKKKLVIDGVHTIYVPQVGPRFFRGIIFVLYSIWMIFWNKGLTLVHYFEKCEYLKRIVFWKSVILDIRTLSINTDNYKREKHNAALKNAIKYFDHVTLISEGVLDKLELSKKNCSILPLGADVISASQKKFNRIRLLYVGTLNGRNISETVLGLYNLLQHNSNTAIESYDIIGEGEEFEALRKLIKEKGLESIITLHGRIPHFELQPFFDKCNVGVSYIPMTDYYQFQPPTKTYEYILSGLPCIATNTYENHALINDDNGVLCDDTHEGFANALIEVNEKKNHWRSDTVRATLIDHTWQNIVEQHLKPVLKANRKK